jgi:two-component system sensor histidine kinase RpfC
VVGKILERGGHTAMLVNDGEQALDALERERYDIVLLDRNMPVMGGMETLQALRLMTRGQERLPVIMLSADATLEAKHEAMEGGADAFLPKPIEAIRLLDEIQALATPKPEEPRRPEARVAAVGTRPKGDRAQIVNTETLGHLDALGSAPGFVEKLIRVFLDDSALLLTRIEQALAGRNYHEFRSLMHAVKGSSASMGTDRLTGLCNSLGKLSDSELRLQAPGLQRSLVEELAAARSELERYVKNQQRSAS